MVEIDSGSGQLIDVPNLIMRGIVQQDKNMNKQLTNEIKNFLLKRKGRVTDWLYVRKNIGQITERFMDKTLHKHPLVLPVVVEV